MTNVEITACHATCQVNVKNLRIALKGYSTLLSDTKKTGGDRVMGKAKKNQLTLLGVEIKKRLIELNMTQREFAARIGANENYINLILYGERSGAKYLDKIGQVLNIDINKFREIA